MKWYWWYHVMFFWYFFFYCGKIYIKLTILTIFKCTVHNVYFKMFFTLQNKVRLKIGHPILYPSGFVCVWVWNFTGLWNEEMLWASQSISLLSVIQLLLVEENSEALFRIFKIHCKNKSRSIYFILLFWCSDKVLLILVFCVYILFCDIIKTVSFSSAVP